MSSAALNQRNPDKENMAAKSFLKMDDNHLLASSGEGTIQSFDLRTRRPDIQSEVYESELNCMATVRSRTKLCVGSGVWSLYLFK